MPPRKRLETKTVRLQVRLTEGERNALNELAELGSTSPQEIVVATIRQLLRATPYFYDQEFEALMDLRDQILKSGINLNQIARKANANVERVSVDKGLLSEAIEQYKSAIMRIDEVAKAQVSRWITPK